jgi:DNA repair ATPase RecN
MVSMPMVKAAALQRASSSMDKTIAQLQEITKQVQEAVENDETSGHLLQTAVTRLQEAMGAIERYTSEAAKEES